MAKKGRPSASDVESGMNETPAEREASEEGLRFRSYKNDGKGFDDLDEGEEITGVLVSIRNHSIQDIRTKKPKEVRVYVIRTEEGALKIAGRALLDRLADDIMDENGGFNVENKQYSGAGYAWFAGRAVKFIRGKDSKTRDNNRMGTYEILVEED